MDNSLRNWQRVVMCRILSTAECACLGRSRQESLPALRCSGVPRWRIFLLLLLAFAVPAFAQRSGVWRVYQAIDGMPESACASVTLSAAGRVLVTHPHADAISELDGYVVKAFPLTNHPLRVCESPAGQIWAVSRDGLHEFKEGSWIAHPVPEIAAFVRDQSPGTEISIPLLAVRQGVVLFLLPRGLAVFNTEIPAQPRTEWLRNADSTEIGTFSGMTPAHDGGLWISAAHGFAKVPGPLRNLRPDTEWLQFVPPPSLSIAQLRGPCEDGEGGVTALANPAGGTETLWVGFDGQAWQVQPAGGDRIRHVWRAGDGTRWAATAEMLFQYDAARARWIESEEITARGYADVAVEPGGAFWLATADGLFRYAPALWRATDSTRAINSPVRCVAADLAGGFWFAADDALHCVSNNLRRDYPFPSDAAAALSSAGGLFPLKNGDVVLDTAEGPWLFRPAEEKFSPVAPDAAGRRLRVLGILPDGDVCVISAAPGDSTPARALAFDGRRLIDLPFTLPFGCNAAKLSSCFATPGGDFWLGTGDGVFLRHEQQWRAFTAAAEKTAPESPVCFCETSDGTTWCGAADQVWRFDGRDWLLSRAGLGRVNGLAATHDGSLWAASNLGVHRCTQGAWLENGVEEGLPSLAVRAICADNQGRLWAATTRGLGVFHPEAATEPPVPFISPLQDNQTAIPMGGTATLTFGAREKWRFTPIIRLLYSYRLDASDWSPFGDLNGISYANLAAGPHSFQVRAMDRNGNISKPAQLAFSVSPPWFEETRLLLVAIAGASIAVFFAGLAFNRHRRLLRSYAEVERKVAERTRQLDLAHRELLHAQKMNALGTLAAGIAHDFNNILSIIKGSAQIIEDNPANPEKILTRVDRIKTVVEQGSGIVKAMLGFSRESDAKPAPCDLNAVVEDTVKLLGDRFLRDVEVRFEPAPGLPAVASPRDFVQQILLNFIFNAAESMRDSKHVFLATLPLGRLPAGVVLPPDLAPAYVGITVRDEGCGIAPEVLPRIFEPFFTTKALSTRRGTGLGLSMVYELARKMGAGLAVQSEVNRGSTFTLILPLRSPPAGPGPPEAAGEIQTEHERTHHLDR